MTIESFDIEIKQLESTRTVWVYLPEGYNKQRRFPVVYLQDGQNLFYEKLAYQYNAWRADKTMDELNAVYDMPCILVGVESSRKRFDEYSPWKTTDKVTKEENGAVGGLGDAYAEFFARDLVAYVDGKYKTEATKEARAVCGASLGAFISAYIGLKNPDVFSAVGCMSIPTEFALGQFNGFVDKLAPNESKVFVYVGGNEGGGDDGISRGYEKQATNFYDRLHSKTKRVRLVFDGEGTHSAESWSKAFFDFALNWLKGFYGKN